MKDLDTLIRKYNDLVIKDHHKDHDCRFGFEETYAYGEYVGVEVNHWGYINNVRSHPKYKSIFDTLSEAESFLCECLTDWIKELEEPNND